MCGSWDGGVCGCGGFSCGCCSDGFGDFINIKGCNYLTNGP